MKPATALLLLSLVAFTAANPCILHTQDSHDIQATNIADVAFQRYVMCVQLDLKIKRMNSYGVQLYRGQGQLSQSNTYSELIKKVIIQTDGIKETLHLLNRSSISSEKSKLKLMEALRQLQQDGEEIIQELNNFMQSQFQMPKNKRSWNAIEGKFANRVITTGSVGDKWEEQIQTILIQFFNQGLDLFETCVFFDGKDEEIVAIGETVLQNMKFFKQSIVDVEAMLRDSTTITENKKEMFLSYSSRATAEMKRARSNIKKIVEKAKNSITPQPSASLRSNDI